MLSSPINEVLDLQKCVDCLRNYTRMYGCYLTQCVYTGYIDSWILPSLYVLCILGTSMCMVSSPRPVGMECHPFFLFSDGQPLLSENNIEAASSPTPEDCILCSLTELEQLKKGLTIQKFITLMIKFPELVRTVFAQPSSPIISSVIEKLYSDHVVIAPKGSEK